MDALPYRDGLLAVCKAQEEVHIGGDQVEGFQRQIVLKLPGMLLAVFVN